MLKKKINELHKEVGLLKKLMDAVESRIAEYEDHEMIISTQLVQTLQQQSQLEGKCEDLES